MINVEKDSRRPLEYGKDAVKMMMRKYKANELPPKGHFHYHQGVFLSGVYKTYLLCGEDSFFNYVKEWIDSIMDEEGNIIEYEPGQIDDIQPGILLYPLIDKFGVLQTKYKKALDSLIRALEKYPRTSDGGLWHRAWLNGQLWLDGLYMADPIMAEYAFRYNRPDITEAVVKHVRSVYTHNYDTDSGLLFHAYDENKKESWADKNTGLSQEIWGRSVGWVPVAILDVLDFMDEKTNEYEELRNTVCKLLDAILNYQGRNGMWYQVINRQEEAGNWTETSCTCLFTAAICKAIRKGKVKEEKFLSAAHKAYDAVISQLKYDEDGDVQIGGVCIGTGVGDYEYYCKRPVSVNDLHGVGAFLLMCEEAEQVF